MYLMFLVKTKVRSKFSYAIVESKRPSYAKLERSTPAGLKLARVVLLQ